MNTAARRAGSAWPGSFILLSISVAVFAAVIIIDFVMTGQLISTDPQPRFAGFYLLRTLALAISAILLVVSVVSAGPPAAAGREEKKALVVDLQAARISIPTPLILGVGLVLPLACALLLVFDPARFTFLSNEDGIIEMLSALILFFSAAHFLFLLRVLYRAKKRRQRLVLAGLAFLAAVVFVIGMEEVSWFQRSFGIETPEAFSGNKQNEMNLHNFASNEIEIAYYFAGFFLFVLFPFLYRHWPFLQKTSLFSFFAPGTMILFFSAPSIAFNYNLWNNATIQFAFFATAAILATYAFRAFSRPGEPAGRHRLYAAGLCLATCAIQVIFLLQGQHLLKGWEVTEYKEFFIPLSFFVYSLVLVMRTEKRIGLRLVAVNFGVSVVFLALRVMQKLNN